MYKITTYPKGRLDITEFSKEQLQTHKALKGRNCIEGMVEEFDTFEGVVRRAAEVPITPSELKEGKRKRENVLSTQLIILDIDEGYTLQEAEMALDKSGYQYGIYTSYSHQLYGKDKFHVIFPVDGNLNTEAEYKATYTFLSQSIFNEQNDSQTSSPANLFFNSNPNSVQIIFNKVNASLVPIIKPSIPTVTNNLPTTSKLGIDRYNSLSKRTLRFLKVGAAEGQWHQELVNAIKNLKSAGFSVEEAIEELNQITGILTPEDKYQVTYGYKDNRYNYNVELLSKDMHPLRIKYTDQKGKFLPIPEREIIDSFKNEKFLNIHVNGQFTLDNTFRDFTYVYEEIRHYALTEMQTRISQATVESVLHKLTIDEKSKRLEEVKAFVAYDKSVTFDFEKLCKAITGFTDELTVAIIKHFLWQIKRKLNDSTVEWHIMPVLVGDSGAGKSKLIKQMLSPLHELVYWDGDFKKLVDSREVFNLSNYYIYFMDEMSKADNADVESIKNKITSDDIQYRKLGTNTTFSAPNRTTFIGAANIKIDQIIKDPTSARRFFQITTIKPMDWSVTNTMNYLDMWKSIDENKGVNDLYIKNHMDQLFAVQQTFKYKTPIEIFVEEEKISTVEYNNAKRITRKSLYKSFMEWSAENGYKYTTNKHNFCETLRAIVGEPLRGRIEGSVCDYYNLPPKKDEATSLN